MQKKSDIFPNVRLKRGNQYSVSSRNVNVLSLIFQLLKIIETTFLLIVRIHTDMYILENLSNFLFIDKKN